MFCSTIMEHLSRFNRLKDWNKHFCALECQNREDHRQCWKIIASFIFNLWFTVVLHNNVQFQKKILLLTITIMKYVWNCSGSFLPRWTRSPLDNELISPWRLPMRDRSLCLILLNGLATAVSGLASAINQAHVVWWIEIICMLRSGAVVSVASWTVRLRRPCDGENCRTLAGPKKFSLRITAQDNFWSQSFCWIRLLAVLNVAWHSHTRYSSWFNAATTLVIATSSVLVFSLLILDLSMSPWIYRESSYLRGPDLGAWNRDVSSQTKISATSLVNPKTVSWTRMRDWPPTTLLSYRMMYAYRKDDPAYLGPLGGILQLLHQPWTSFFPLTLLKILARRARVLRGEIVYNLREG